MESFDHDPGRARPASGTPDAADGAATLAGDRQLGAHARRCWLPSTGACSRTGR
jgi:hypothetical protein